MTSPTTAQPRAGAPAQYLTFTLAGETFAIGILAIKEIIEYRAPTEVPMMPASVRGVINLRGAVVPVMDLLARFGRPPSAVGKRTCIVIVEVAAHDERQVIGVVVDAGQRGAGDRRRRDRAAAQLRRPHPRRLHRRHRQGARQVRHPARCRPCAVVGRDRRPGPRPLPAPAMQPRRRRRWHPLRRCDHVTRPTVAHDRITDQEFRASSASSTPPRHHAVAVEEGAGQRAGWASACAPRPAELRPLSRAAVERPTPPPKCRPRSTC